MALFTALTSQQQASLQNNDMLVRDAVLKSRIAIAAMKIAALDYTTISQSISATLDAGQVVPPQTGLIGAIPVLPADVDALMTAFQSLITMWDTPTVRADHAQYVGAINIDG